MASKLSLFMFLRSCNRNNDIFTHIGPQNFFSTCAGLFIFEIDLEEYGEALELAQRFKLDTDLVYQRQWTKSPITVISIKDYLVSITVILYARRYVSSSLSFVQPLVS